jgi:hypothetical protein
MPSLAEMQARFRTAVLGQDNAPVDDFVRGSIDVYRTTVQASLIDVLATAFPVTQRVVGAGFFNVLARRFIVAAPPRVPQLSVYGGGFADFIAGEEVGRHLPYLPDVARLEWARGECYFAADAPALDAARLAALGPDDLERAVLALHPATRLIASPFPVYRIWEVNQPAVADVPRVDMTVGQWALVSRRGHHVVTREIVKADAAFLAVVMAGKTLTEAAAAITDARFDLQQALQDHFINGTFRDL